MSEAAGEVMADAIPFAPVVTANDLRRAITHCLYYAMEAGMAAGDIMEKGPEFVMAKERAYADATEAMWQKFDAVIASTAAPF